MEFAEQYATPTDAQLGTPFAKRNDFKELFYLRWGKLRFDVRWGSELTVSYTHLRAHETVLDIVCRLLLEKKNKRKKKTRKKKKTSDENMLHTYN